MNERKNKTKNMIKDGEESQPKSSNSSILSSELDSRDGKDFDDIESTAASAESKWSARNKDESFDDARPSFLNKSSAQECFSTNTESDSEDENYDDIRTSKSHGFFKKKKPSGSGKRDSFSHNIMPRGFWERFSKAIELDTNLEFDGDEENNFVQPTEPPPLPTFKDTKSKRNIIDISDLIEEPRRSDRHEK
jgi:hypothetical protein